MKKLIQLVVLAITPIILLTGCATANTYNASMAGTVQKGVVTSVNHPKAIKVATDVYKKATGNPLPVGQDIINVLLHYGVVDGWRWAGGFAQHDTLEIGDIVEWTYPKSDKEYGTLRLISKWNDKSSGGCYWTGGFRYQSGDVVCNDNPDAGEIRAKQAEWLRSNF